MIKELQFRPQQILNALDRIRNFTTRDELFRVPSATWSVLYLFPETSPHLRSFGAGVRSEIDLKIIQDKLIAVRPRIPLLFKGDKVLGADNLLEASFHPSLEVKDPMVDVVLASAHPLACSTELQMLMGGLFLFLDGGWIEFQWNEARSPESFKVPPIIFLPNIIQRTHQPVFPVIKSNMPWSPASAQEMMKALSEAPHVQKKETSLHFQRNSYGGKVKIEGRITFNEGRGFRTNLYWFDRVELKEEGMSQSRTLYAAEDFHCRETYVENFFDIPVPPELARRQIKGGSLTTDRFHPRASQFLFFPGFVWEIRGYPFHYREMRDDFPEYMGTYFEYAKAAKGLLEGQSVEWPGRLIRHKKSDEAGIKVLSGVYNNGRANISFEMRFNLTNERGIPLEWRQEYAVRGENNFIIDCIPVRGDAVAAIRRYIEDKKKEGTQMPISPSLN